MILLIPIAVLILVMMIGRLIAPVYRRRRIRAELRGDWWAAFEHDLREYMSHTWSSAREAERHL